VSGKASGAKTGLLLCLFLLVFLAGSALADTVNYIYDNLGRLVMAVSSNGTLIVYDYDQAGHIISTTRTTANSSLPVITGITPQQVFIGSALSITVTGNNLLTTDGVTTDNPGIRITSFSQSSNSVIIDAQIQGTAAVGPATFTITTPSGSASISLNLLSLTFSPARLVLATGTYESVTARIDGLTSDYSFVLTNQNADVVSAPQSVTVPVAGTATFIVKALSEGTDMITAGNSVLAVFVTKPFSGAGTAASKPVSVWLHNPQPAFTGSRAVSVQMEHWADAFLVSPPVSVEISPQMDHETSVFSVSPPLSVEISSQP
jgi:YD repeat-containing protein